MEKNWKELMEDYDVYVEIDVIYPEGSLRPERFNIKTVVSDRNTGKEIASRTTNFLNETGQSYTKLEI